MRAPTIKTWRRLIQLGVAAAFIVIPLLNHFRINVLTGNFLAFRAGGLTLADPLAVLQITLKNFYLSMDLLTGAAIALGLAVILGTVFCSWICPFGLLSELTQDAARRRSARGNRVAAERSTGFSFKVALFVLGLAGFLVFSTTPVLNQLSLPAWYSRIFQFYFEQGHVSLAIVFLTALLAVEFALRQRLWCRYICPQSVLLMTVKLLNPSRLKVHFERERCVCAKPRDPCHQACSLSLDPKTLGDTIDAACNNCGDCVVACKRRGAALSYGFKNRGKSGKGGKI